MSVLELFCHVDDFCRTFEARWHQQCLASTTKRRNRARELALSEIMTILILFDQSHYRTFKAFDTDHVCSDLRGEFPTWSATRALWSSFLARSSGCACSCTPVWVPVPACRLSTLPSSRCATIGASGSIGSFAAWLNLARPQSIGSL